jgi:hypothetical protein
MKVYPDISEAFEVGQISRFIKEIFFFPNTHSQFCCRRYPVCTTFLDNTVGTDALRTESYHRHEPRNVEMMKRTPVSNQFGLQQFQHSFAAAATIGLGMQNGGYVLGGNPQQKPFHEQHPSNMTPQPQSFPNMGVMGMPTLRLLPLCEVATSLASIRVLRLPGHSRYNAYDSRSATSKQLAPLNILCDITLYSR